MRRYETIAIVDPDIPPESRVPLLERCNEIIDQHSGQIVEVDEWGTRQLAYEIKKKPRGFYVLFNYCGEGDLVQELERFFRIDDRVLKYMTVLLDKEVDLEQIKEEIAGAEAKKAASEQEAEVEAESGEPEKVEEESETAEPENDETEEE
jgi:small subunit ribosomal protein S6